MVVLRIRCFSVERQRRSIRLDPPRRHRIQRRRRTREVFPLLHGNGGGGGVDGLLPSRAGRKERKMRRRSARLRPSVQMVAGGLRLLRGRYAGVGGVEHFQRGKTIAPEMILPHHIEGGSKANAHDEHRGSRKGGEGKRGERGDGAIQWGIPPAHRVRVQWECTTTIVLLPSPTPRQRRRPPQRRTIRRPLPRRDQPRRRRRRRKGRGRRGGTRTRLVFLRTTTTHIPTRWRIRRRWWEMRVMEKIRSTKKRIASQQ